MSKTLRRFSFRWVGVHCFFSPQESNELILSALLGPGMPCVIFTRPAVFALEIQPQMVRKPHSAGCDLTNLRQRCCTLFLQPRVSIFVLRCRRVSIFSCEAGGRVNFSATDRSLVNLFPARRSVRGFLTLGLLASPLRVHGTGWAPLGIVESLQRLQVLAERILCCP
ncbi:hypothetical protein NDU88_002701 [Pleurodeles waltl]|uniref:Uncharacterized protein n=1 Tax=Pleurodeles waltl TaxID=8319 RepID=A0AAV7T2M4_PLEWA|nr:hypothetical protein NDU88_002701 [Pleurodeles waltl]